MTSTSTAGGSGPVLQETRSIVVSSLPNGSAGATPALAGGGDRVSTKIGLVGGGDLVAERPDAAPTASSAPPSTAQASIHPAATNDPLV